MNPPIGAGAPKGLLIVTFKTSPCLTWEAEVNMAYGGTDVCAWMSPCLGVWSSQAWNKNKKIQFW